MKALLATKDFLAALYAPPAQPITACLMPDFKAREPDFDSFVAAEHLSKLLPT
jgi:hypothetical protein